MDLTFIAYLYAFDSIKSKNMDLIMPIIDGIGVLEIINSEEIAIPEIMVLSAMGHEDIVIKGYQFLRAAVKKVMELPTLIYAITKELYSCVAKEFETTASKVERAIRHAIEVAWNRGKIENINEIFGYNIYTKNDKPANGEFIAIIADKLLIDRSA